MSYFEVKTIKGHDYLYLRQSIRVGKRVIHKHIAYLGRVDGGRVTGSSGSSQTITQAKREAQPKPKVEPEREPIKEPITKPEIKPEVKPKIEPKVKPKAKGKRFKVKLRDTGQAPAGRVKTDRSQEFRDKEKLLRKKKKKLKKFLRKKKLKEIPRDEQGRFIPTIPQELK